MIRLALPVSLAAFFIFTVCVAAQRPPPRLLHVKPPGGKAGDAFEIALHGTVLDEVNEVRFSHTGISATHKATNLFEVKIASDVPPGVYDVVAIGKNGVSNPRAFSIGVLAEVARTKNSIDNPQRVALESTINGQTEANAIDYFRFEAKQGQRVLVRCAARDIDSKLEPVLALHDAAGRELSRSRAGGLLDCRVVEGGEFTLRVHDVIFRAGPEYFYRLSVGTFPHIDYMLPLAGGEKARFAVFGRNLPGGKIVEQKKQAVLEQIEIEIPRNDPSLVSPLVTMPAQAALDLFEYRLRTGHGVSDAAVVLFPTAAVIAEKEPNNTSAGAQEITLPCEVAGRFHPNGDRDWFRFEARKGDVYWIEVVSHRLGAGTDPFVLVRRVTTNGTTDVLELNDSEANFGGPEFNTAHRDPAGKWEVKETGSYLVQVRDFFTHSHRNQSLAYQLAVRAPAPDFKLVALPGNPLPPKKDAKDIGVNVSTIRRGETLPTKVMAFRRDGFDGEIAVDAVDFPSDVTATPCRIEGGKNSALTFVTAGEDAAPFTGTAALRGTASINGAAVRRTAMPGTVVWGTADPANEAALARLAASPMLCVRDELVPVRVHPESNVVETVAGKTVKVNFLIDRRASSAGGVKLKPFGLAALDSVPEVDVDASATNLVLQIDLREKKVPAGMHVFALQVSPQPKPAADKSKKPKDPPPAFYSAPVVLNVAPAPMQTNSPAK